MLVVQNRTSLQLIFQTGNISDLFLTITAHRYAVLFQKAFTCFIIMTKPFSVVVFVKIQSTNVPFCIAHRQHCNLKRKKTCNTCFVVELVQEGELRENRRTADWSVRCYLVWTGFCIGVVSDLSIDIVQNDIHANRK